MLLGRCVGAGSVAFILGLNLLHCPFLAEFAWLRCCVVEVLVEIVRSVEGEVLVVLEFLRGWLVLLLFLVFFCRNIVFWN